MITALAPSQLAAEPLLGEVRIFAGNFAPRGWALCEGQVLPINKNAALFSILGTKYGGDGRTTFGLPDLRGRAPIHPGATDPGMKMGGVGSVQGAASVKTTKLGKGDATVTPTLRMNYIICLEGRFPSRI